MGHWHLLFRQIEPIGEPGIPGQVLRTGNWKAAHSHIPIRLIGTLPRSFIGATRSGLLRLCLVYASFVQ